MERTHPGRHLDPGGAAGHVHRRHRDPGVCDGPLDGGRRRRGHPPHLGGRPDRRQEQHLDRHLLHRRHDGRSAARLVPAAADAFPQARQQADADRVAAGSDGVEHPGPLHRAGLRAGRGRGCGAAGAGVLAEHPQGAVPGVRQRRRGLVQPDVVHDGHRVLGPRPDRRAAGLGRPVVRGPAGRPGRPLHLRLPVRGLRQLALQRGLRGDVQGHAGRHHPAALAERRREADQGRNPGDNVPVLPGLRAGRRRLRYLGPSDGPGGLHRRGRRGRQRPGQRQRRGGAQRLQARPVRDDLAAHQADQRLRRGQRRHRRGLLPVLPCPAEPGAAAGARGGRCGVKTGRSGRP
ncbi:putative Arginine/ornithine antiporter ArcD [Actinacidiphila bryophytorum]|uniref:Arginine/ornithine antiporter ArcD n=1 Tax=Actinacidiphila bryophytorum TaxID=1436133 RepID=A0A9W4H6A4_9ACTN|nr:putative Arginine/ornithine antiporter ArcD [Actinacidiphila bryophytorum]